jgi:hypothetical protein
MERERKGKKDKANETNIREWKIEQDIPVFRYSFKNLLEVLERRGGGRRKRRKNERKLS